jgi:hypothetical protein
MATTLPLTPGRLVALALGVPVVLALIGWAGFSTVALADQAGVRVHLSVADGQRTQVTIDNPDATIHPGPGGRIWVSGTLRGSLARPTFSWRSTAAGLALRSRCWAPTGFCSLNYDITVPAGRPLAVSDGSGNLNAGGFGGRVWLSDGSGDLNASGLAGTISLNDGSGDITASGLTGDRVRVSDGSGDIVVTGLAATDVTGNDSSGGLTLRFTKVPRRVDVTDGSGDITLMLPPGPTSYHVNAQSSSGSTTISVKRSLSSPYLIVASDNSGDITIS